MQKWLYHVSRMEDIKHPERPLQKLQDRYEGVSKSFRTGLLEQELQMIQLSATMCTFIVIL